MTKHKTIVGNWKMHGTPETAAQLAGRIAEAAAGLPPDTDIVLCPPALFLPQVAAAVAGSRVKLGGQDCRAEPEGAFTGDISAAMLKSAGCGYVILGHSERRRHHGETDEAVRAKAAAAMAAGLTPILCVGETEEQRETGKAERTVGDQIRQSLPPQAGEGGFVLAYEPVWAIGTGKIPTPEDIERMHAHALTVAATQTGLAQMRISVLYGGSVNAANAGGILAVKGVGGALVGGASLKADEFRAILAAAT